MELAGWLRLKAARDGRSLNSLIVSLLERGDVVDAADSGLGATVEPAVDRDTEWQEEVNGDAGTVEQGGTEDQSDESGDRTPTDRPLEVMGYPARANGTDGTGSGSGTPELVVATVVETAPDGSVVTCPMCKSIMSLVRHGVAAGEWACSTCDRSWTSERLRKMGR